MWDSIVYIWYRIKARFSKNSRMEELKKRDPFIYEE